MTSMASIPGRIPGPTGSKRTWPGTTGVRWSFWGSSRPAPVRGASVVWISPAACASFPAGSVTARSHARNHDGTPMAARTVDMNAGGMRRVCGRDIVIRGRLVRIAYPELDSYESLGDPEPVLDGLRTAGVRADLFSFMQAVPDVVPRYSYRMEWDNLAVLPVSTFDHWWEHQLRSFPRNRARQAHKRGVTLGEVAFDDALVHGMWEVYNESPVRQ